MYMIYQLWENIEPVKEYNWERLDKVGASSEGGIYHKPGPEDLT